MDKAPQKLTISTSWMPLGSGSRETAHTSVAIDVKAGDTSLTLNRNNWSHSVGSEAFVSAYPLAIWFASSWWRLRWEPGADRQQSSDWLLSHLMSGANEGFLWPNLRFESTGEFIEIQSRAYKASTKEMVRFLSDENVLVAANDFESAIDDFVARVIVRMDSFQLGRSELHELWDELSKERNDAKLSKARRLEAIAGFDPGEMGDKALNSYLELEGTAGNVATAEVAAACAGSNPAGFLQKAISQARKAVTPAKIPNIDLGQVPVSPGKPWLEGQVLAQLTRRKFHIPSGPISDRQLAETLELPRKELDPVTKTAERNVGLAIRDHGADDLRLSFRRSNRTSRRFETSRFLCEALQPGEKEQWFAQTDSRTARQKRQRAFAIEFLCPFEELRKEIPDYPTDTAIESAAKKYSVSPLAVASQLVNHDVMSAERLVEFASNG